MDLFEKAAEAYQGEIERLFKAAEAKGTVDPAFTPERRAAFYELEKAAGPELMAQLDEIALEAMTPLDRITIYGGLGKMAGMGQWAAGALSKAKDVIGKVPWSKAPTSPFAGLGESEKHFARMRKVLSRPEVTKAPHSLKGDFLGGAAFGGAFGLAQRVMQPKEEPTVQIG